MRKITCLLLICFTITMTGCQTKETRTTYEYETENDSFKYKNTFKLENDGDTLTGVTILTDFSSIKTETIKKQLKQLYTKQRDELKGVDGCTASVDDRRKQIQMNIHVDFDRIDKESFKKIVKNFDWKNDKITVDEFEKYLDEQGYKTVK